MPNKLSISFIVLISIVVIFLCCQKGIEKEKNMEDQKPVFALKNLEWIVGTWKQETSRGTTYESWQMINDSFWQGQDYRVTGIDTVVMEKLSLEITDDGVFYVPVVPHNEGAVYFKMIEQSPNKVIFENPAHDFPQRIIYMKISNDSLHARIEGINEGEESAVDFYFSRIKR